jgi:hypothetical protein
MTTLVEEAVELAADVVADMCLANPKASMLDTTRAAIKAYLAAALPTDVAGAVAGDGPGSCSSDAGLDRAGDDHSAAACSSDGPGPLERLHYNLACAPPDAKKCFVSLDDHRAIIAAFDALPTDDDVERVAKVFESIQGYKGDEHREMARAAIHTLIGRAE